MFQKDWVLGYEGMTLPSSISWEWRPWIGSYGGGGLDESAERGGYGEGITRRTGRRARWV